MRTSRDLIGGETRRSKSADCDWMRESFTRKMCFTLYRVYSLRWAEGAGRCDCFVKSAFTGRRPSSCLQCVLTMKLGNYKFVLSTMHLHVFIDATPPSSIQQDSGRALSVTFIFNFRLSHFA